VRQLILFGIVIAAVVAILWARPVAPPSEESPTLAYVTTAHQLGVVGYRDPAGAISPDGKHFAYAEGRFIRVIPIGGGAPLTLAPGEGQIRYLTWSSPSDVVAEDPTPVARWWKYSIGRVAREPLWGANILNAHLMKDVRQLTWNRGHAVGLASTKEGAELWQMGRDGAIVSRKPLKGRPSFPTFGPGADDSVACIIDDGRGPRLSYPCGVLVTRMEPDRDVYGPLVFIQRGAQVDGSSALPTDMYFGSPDGFGMVQLWRFNSRSRTARQVTTFARDAYAPTLATDGTVVFKVQSYRTHLADVAAEGGLSRQLTTFQSETPSYHPTLPLIAFTYGTWRRVLDDAKYPDIAQEIGTIDASQSVPAGKPLEVLEESDSEDQAMAWSPNGKWIAFHTHREMSDDVWLRPVDGSLPDKRITFLGRGAEVGWPRWSPDGKFVLLDGARQSDGRSVIYAIGVDQETGNVTSDLREVSAAGFGGDITHAEWLGNESVIAIGKEGPGRHAIFTLPLGGGAPKVVHRFATEHDFPGLGVSPDGRFVAFVGPAPDGYYQIFTKAIAGGAVPVQITTDPSNKTQPAWSPDGRRIAFTIWSYDATFWSFNTK
jgi:hypothetical protein